MNRKTITLTLAVLVVLGLGLVPQIIKKDNIINLAILVFIYVMMAVSWNFIGGIAGQTNLGHAAFFGLGFLIARMLWTEHRWPLFPCLLLGALVPVGFAMLIGIPAFKLKGAYFAIGTLAMAQILFITVRNLFPMMSFLPGDELAAYSLRPRYYLAFGSTLLTIAAAIWISRSRWGLGMRALREEATAAESLGVNVLGHKLMAFGLSAFFGGLAGGVFAYYAAGYYYFFPFAPTWTFDAVMATYIGGMGTIIGPILGAVFYVVVKEILALRLVEVHLIVFGVLFILIVLFLPGGLVQVWDKIRHLQAPSSRQQAPEPVPCSPDAVLHSGEN